MVKKFVLLLVICFVLVEMVSPGQAMAWESVVKQVFPGNGERVKEPIHSKVPRGRIFLLSVDYLGMDDLGRLPPHLSHLFKTGAVALMNVNTAGAANLENAYATIGAGAHVTAPSTAESGYFENMTDSEAVNQYGLWTGRHLQQAALVYPAVEKLKSMNQKLKYQVVPGALAAKVRESGFQTAVFGNSDSINGPRRPVLTMVMDKEGFVDAGMIDENSIKADSHFPGGVTTDYESILKGLSSLPDNVGLVAVELGDLARLKDLNEYMTEEQWRWWRGEVLGETDTFIGSLLGQIDKERDLIVLFSPIPDQGGAEENDTMSPVVFYGGGIEPGILTSPTTRRPGIIMNIDIAPTVHQFLGIRPGSFLPGRSVQVMPGNFGVQQIISMDTVLKQIYEARPFLQKGYVFFQIIILGVSLGFIFFRKKGKEKLKPIFLAVMAVPLAYLVMPLLPSGSILHNGIELVFLTVMITAIVLVFNQRLEVDPFLLIGLTTTFAIALDLALGSPLQRTSILGYDPIAGARFYGLGNEYMGVLIGSTLIGTAAFITRAVKWRRPAVYLSGLVYLGVFYLIAAPQFGTNVGGSVAASSAFLMTLLLFFQIKFTRKRIVAVIAGLGVLLLGLLFYDAARPVEYQSHIGRTVSLIAAGGFDQMLYIISRKSEMNIKLIKYTIWSRVLLASLAILALLFYRPVGVMENIKRKFPYLFKGLVGVVVGSIVAFLFNDSGVVAAATVMIFGAPPLVYLVLDQQEA